ncbi:MAG: hypothetical protein LBC18_16025, partial [Opitutaceae bacterium]|nr:hypothetical protein [Opitutaceae bacterium]
MHRFFLHSACLAAVALLAMAAAPGARAQVRASLVSADAAVQPGRAFTVALKLEHQPHWHTYWLNAGTGYPTSLKWELPGGWQADGIRWPVPGVIRDGTGAVTGNGYDGTVLLPVTLTPPANLLPGETVTLRAKAAWLMCADVCMPGGADVTLTLPVGAGAPAPDAAVTAALAGNAGAAPHFFCADELVAFDKPQVFAPAAGDGGGVNGGGFTLTLPLSEDAGVGDGGGARLVGVLAFERADGARQGFAIAVAVAGGGAAACAGGGINSAVESGDKSPHSNNTGAGAGIPSGASADVSAPAGASVGGGIPAGASA